MKWKVLQMPQSYEMDSQVSNESFGRFIIQPLERGYGYTLGNTLRRVLLSSLQGAAVVACKVNNSSVLHEFSSVPGVLEDATDIVLNLKQIRFKHYGDGPRTGDCIRIGFKARHAVSHRADLGSGGRRTQHDEKRCGQQEFSREHGSSFG